MELFQILDGTICSTDISSCCSDYGLATYIYIIKEALNLIHLVVPIILIVMGVVQLIKMMTNPDDQGGKLKKSLLNKVFAAVLIFLFPIILDIIMNAVSVSFDTFQLHGCWQAADDIVTIMSETEELEYDDYNVKKVGDTYSGVTATKEKDANRPNADNNKNTTESTTENNNSDVTETSKSAKKTQKEVVKYAKKFEGNKYVYGGNSLTNGIDCSGFTQQVYKKFGYNIPRTSGEQAASNSLKDVNLNNLQKGDLLFYGNGNDVNHVALYIGDNKIIHASNSKPYPRGGIKINNYNYRTPIKAKRVIS